MPNKILLILSFVVSSLLELHAQSPYHIEGGLFYGSTVQTESPENQFVTLLGFEKPTVNAQIGVGYSRYLFKQLGCGIDVLYSLTGYASSYTKRNFQHYLAVQPFLSYTFQDKWRIKGGLSMDLLVYPKYYNSNRFEFGTAWNVQRILGKYAIGLKFERYFTPHTTDAFGSASYKMYHKQIGLTLSRSF